MALTMATMSTSENTPNLQCDLCWETFPTSAELADHIDQEEWTLYPMPGNSVDR